MRLGSSWFWYAALLALGVLLYLLCRLFPRRPSILDAVGVFPGRNILAWTFSHCCGSRAGFIWYQESAHPPIWRKTCFVAGIASFYIVLQTHVDYYAQHMFFVHRWAHFVLHHAGGFFVALGAAGPAVYAGMPDFP